jgi:hypothetical protein
MATSTSVRVTGLGKQKMSRIVARAKQMGLTPEEYVRQLVEEDLRLDHVARTKSFSEILGPGQEVDEAELDKLVDRAKRRHYRETNGNRH